MDDRLCSPLISICVPVYEVEQYIDRCANSLLNQSYINIELIFVDDCGKDHSVEILNKAIEKYPEKKSIVIHHISNRGLAAARNTAVAAANGEFIMHIDSDDWLEPNAVEALVDRQLETGADIVSGNATAHYFGHDEILAEPDYTNKYDMMSNIIELSLDHVLWRRLIRTSLYVNNGITAVEGCDIGEDHYTLPRLLFYAKSFAKVDAVVYHYNQMNAKSYMSSSSKGVDIRYLKSNVNALDILLQFFSDKDKLIVKRLDSIKSSYLKRNIDVSLVFGERNAYYYIKRLLNNGWSFYAIDIIPVLIYKLLHKLTGKNYKRLQ